MSKKIYPSKYSNEKVTSQQFLCDEIMERIAKKAGETLPFKYWNVSRWKKTYLHQVTAAGKLLQECDVVAIMAFLRSVNGRKIISLGLKKQIFDGCQISINTKTNITCEYDPNDMGIYEFIEEVPEEEIPSEPKASLWEKLNG